MITTTTARCRNHLRQRSYFTPRRRYLSETPEEAEPRHVQAFVHSTLEPGEWDVNQTDPLYRPVWKNRTRIISAEDYANRPTVGFSAEFDNFSDAMVTESWLDDGEQKEIFHDYLETITHMKAKSNTSSHEYAIKCIAQRHNITAVRAAAIVQLQHNEARYRAEGRELLDDLQAAMDKEAKDTLRDAYSAYGMRPPASFVETPMGISGTARDSKKWQIVEDEFDVDELMKNAMVREKDKARVLIDNHIYNEDIDDEAVEIPLSKDCRKLLKAQPQLTESSSRQEAGTADWPEKKDKRARWKYVAQVVNTRDLKKKHGGKKKQPSSYTNNSATDTLVEQDGQLRGANLSDVRQTAWKPVEAPLERLYRGAKQGWLDFSVRGETQAWGKGPENTKVVTNVARFLEEGPDYLEKEKKAAAEAAAAAAALAAEQEAAKAAAEAELGTDEAAGKDETTDNETPDNDSPGTSPPEKSD